MHSCLLVFILFLFWSRTCDSLRLLTNWHDGAWIKLIFISKVEILFLVAGGFISLRGLLLKKWSYCWPFCFGSGFFLPTLPLSVWCSVTRFGEISPLRQNYKRLWQMFKCPLSIWQNFEQTLANSFYYWVKIIAVFGQILKKQSSHLVTLVWWLNLKVNSLR